MTDLNTLLFLCWAFCISCTCLKTALCSCLFGHWALFYSCCTPTSKEEDVDFGFYEDLKLDLRPPIGPGELVCRKLGRAILSQDPLSENAPRS